MIKKILVSFFSLSILVSPIAMVFAQGAGGVLPPPAKTQPAPVKSKLPVPPVESTSLQKILSLLQKLDQRLDKIEEILITKERKPDPIKCPYAASIPIFCPDGYERGPGATNADGCYVEGPCVKKTEKPKCESPYIAKEEAGVCWNINAGNPSTGGLVYEFSQTPAQAISLYNYASKNWGSSANCGSGYSLVLGQGRTIKCEYSGTVSLECPSGWIKHSFNYIISSCVENNSYNNATAMATAKKLVDDCVGASSSGNFGWDSKTGLPIICNVSKPGGGGGGSSGYVWDAAKTSCVAGLITARGETLATAQIIAGNMALCSSNPTSCNNLDSFAKNNMGKYGAEGSSSQCWSSGGTGTGSATILPESWKICLREKGVAAGSTQINIDAAFTEINKYLASRTTVQYGNIDNKLYSSIAACDQQTGFYISNQLGGTTWPTGGSYSGGTGSSGDPTTACSQAGGTWNSTSNYCVYPGGSYPSGGTNYSSCDANLIALLGSGCHQMGDKFCDGPMTKSAKTGDTVATNGCVSTAGIYRPSLLSSLISLFVR